MHLRRKKVEMCKLLESVPQVVSEDKETGKLKEYAESKTENLTKARGVVQSRRSMKRRQNVRFCGILCYYLTKQDKNLQCFAEDEPREDFLERVGTTKEEWSKTNRILRDDEPHDDDLKRLGMSKEDFFEAKRRIACLNAFGCDFEKKVRKYWNAFRDGCKGRDVLEMGSVMEENFVMNGMSTSSATRSIPIKDFLC